MGRRCGPRHTKGARMLLAQAVSTEQITRIGDQTGGRVSLFLYTDDIMRDITRFKDGSVVFEADGAAAVFCDLYGNRWDLIEPVESHNQKKAVWKSVFITGVHELMRLFGS